MKSEKFKKPFKILNLYSYHVHYDIEYLAVQKLCTYSHHKRATLMLQTVEAVQDNNEMILS